MKFFSLAVLATSGVPTSAFVVQPSTRTPTHVLMSTPPMPDPERMRQIMEEESKNPANIKASAEMLKNIKPEDIDGMLREMDNMPTAQKKQLEAMGMNPDMMRQSIEMMKANPDMAKQMANMMDTMTPEEIMEKSRQAQANFASGMPIPSPTSAAVPVVDAAVVGSEEEETKEDEEEDDDEDDDEPIAPPEKEILDTLYRTAEIISEPPTGKVTFAGFSSIPPISLLVGNDAELDISQKELKECWASGSLGATRVDRVGFERVWMEAQEYFYLPMLVDARERTLLKKRGTQKPELTVTSVSPPLSSPVGNTKVGQDIPSDILERQVKNMSDKDMDAMLEQMQNMTPEQVARMKAMGVDPKMMEKTAAMMNSNPLMKGAAKMMMKNMSADQMKQASQKAQEQMSKLSPEDIEKAYKELENKTKQ